MKKVSKRWLLGATTLIVVAAGAVIGGVALASGGGSDKPSKDLGQSTGLLPRDHLTLESAINVNLDKETVRLPLYRGEANGETVWFTLMDSSDAGAAHNLGVNYRAQARQPGDRLSGVRADGDPGFADPGREQVRSGGGPLPGRARLQPRPGGGAGT